MFRRVTELAAVAALATAASAQVGTAPTLYRLDAASTYEEGCQPPCACPIASTDDLFGTLTIRFSAADPAGYLHYAIEDVNWVVDLLGNERRVTGSGEYRVGGQFALKHELQLDLSIDGATPVRFDSGLVLGGGAFPTIDIAIAQNGFYCWDRVFRVTASEVPAGQSVPFGLARTLYQEGCLPPCLCPISIQRTLGRFELLDLGPASDPAKRHYALLDISWRTRPAPTPAGQTFEGFGMYSLDAATVRQRLICDLTDGNGVRQRFDSGLVGGGAAAPARIRVDIAANGFYCFDKVFRLRARP